jgi:integrase/recombinase XerD
VIWQRSEASAITPSYSVSSTRLACRRASRDDRGRHQLGRRGDHGARKGKRHDRLPLPKDVGEALATYLRHGRPACSARHVFVRLYAPHRGFASSSDISTIVRQAIDRAGLHPPCKGAHLLRHTLATHMLHRGSSLVEIDEVLRHRCLNTTEIYSKVAIEALRALAQPWPGGRV